MGSVYLVERTDDRLYRFKLLSPKGDLALNGTPYAAKSRVEEAIERARQNAPLDERYVSLAGPEGLPYFILVTPGGEVIGKSDIYETTKARDSGITLVKHCAGDARIDDRTT